MAGLIKSIEELEGELTVEIRYDDDCEEPHADDDGTRIVVLSHTYSDPSKGACGKDPEAVEQWRKDNENEWYTVPLWAYVHSNIIFKVGAANPFSVDAQWDSARAGIIALKRSSWGNGAEGDEKMFEFAQAVVASHSAWANGQCYGYVVKNENGEEIDSCWGFIGEDGLAAAEAEARNVAANHATSVVGATAP